MKIEELKVGDRVKYTWKSGVCGSNSFRVYECEGNILEIHDTFFQISNNAFYDNQISVKKEEIICKLDPQYKEIPIEQKQEVKPKSIKFDFEIIQKDIFYKRAFENRYQGATTTIKGRIPGGEIELRTDALTTDAFDVTKEYTIEIKEK